jgi:hypothetical protein
MRKLGLREVCVQVNGHRGYGRYGAPTGG